MFEANEKRNQVLVTGTETKVQFRYQYRSLNFSFRNQNFFLKKIQKRFIFLSCFPTSWGDIDFIDLKKDLEIFSVWQKIWF